MKTITNTLFILIFSFVASVKSQELITNIKSGINASNSFLKTINDDSYFIRAFPNGKILTYILTPEGDANVLLENNLESIPDVEAIRTFDSKLFISYANRVTIYDFISGEKVAIQAPYGYTPAALFMYRYGLNDGIVTFDHVDGVEPSISYIAKYDGQTKLISSEMGILKNRVNEFFHQVKIEAGGVYKHSIYNEKLDTSSEVFLESNFEDIFLEFYDGVAWYVKYDGTIWYMDLLDLEPIQIPEISIEKERDFSLSIHNDQIIVISNEISNWVKVVQIDTKSKALVYSHEFEIGIGSIFSDDIVLYENTMLIPSFGGKLANINKSNNFLFFEPMNHYIQTSNTLINDQYYPFPTEIGLRLLDLETELISIIDNTDFSKTTRQELVKVGSNYFILLANNRAAKEDLRFISGSTYKVTIVPLDDSADRGLVGNAVLSNLNNTLFLQNSINVYQIEDTNYEEITEYGLKQVASPFSPGQFNTTTHFEADGIYYWTELDGAIQILKQFDGNLVKEIVRFHSTLDFNEIEVLSDKIIFSDRVNTVFSVDINSGAINILCSNCTTLTPDRKFLHKKGDYIYYRLQDALIRVDNLLQQDTVELPNHFSNSYVIEENDAIYIANIHLYKLINLDIVKVDIPSLISPARITEVYKHGDLIIYKVEKQAVDYFYSLKNEQFIPLDGIDRVNNFRSWQEFGFVNLQESFSGLNVIDFNSGQVSPMNFTELNNVMIDVMPFEQDTFMLIRKALYSDFYIYRVTNKFTEGELIQYVEASPFLYAYDAPYNQDRDVYYIESGEGFYQLSPNGETAYFSIDGIENQYSKIKFMDEYFYYLKKDDECGLQVFRDVLGDLVSHIPDSSENIDFSIFPNPASETITLKGEKTIPHVKIYDSLGRLVYSQSGIQNNEIDISILPNGIYHLLVTGYPLVQQFIKI